MKTIFRSTKYKESCPQKVKDAQSTRIPSRSIDGECVIGSGTLVSLNLGGFLAYEQPTVVFTTHSYLHGFQCDIVTDSNTLV